MDYALIGEIAFNGAALFGTLQAVLWFVDKFRESIVVDALQDARTLIRQRNGGSK